MQNYKISEADAKQALDSEDTGVVFLSIRKAEDSANGHIEELSIFRLLTEWNSPSNQLRKTRKLLYTAIPGKRQARQWQSCGLLGYDAVSLI
jgi:hypothetical protein